MIEELRKNKELVKLTGQFLGSALGHEIGRKINPQFPVVPMMFGGLIAAVGLELLLKE